MRTFKEYLTESISCSKLTKHFKFSGTLNDNEKGLKLIPILTNSSCESIIDLYCCIRDRIINNFAKTGNMTRVNDNDKKKIVRILRLMTSDLLTILSSNKCNIPNCTNS